MNEKNSKTKKPSLSSNIIAIVLSVLLILFISFMGYMEPKMTNTEWLFSFLSLFVIMSAVLYFLDYKIASFIIIIWLVFQIAYPFTPYSFGYRYQSYSYNIFNFNSSKMITHNYIYIDRSNVIFQSPEYYEDGYNTIKSLFLPISMIEFLSFPKLIMKYNSQYPKGLYKMINETAMKSCNGIYGGKPSNVYNGMIYCEANNE